MKRWYIKMGGVEFICSLLSLKGSSKMAYFKSDGGDILLVKFLKIFDFSRAKDGVEQTSWLKKHGVEHSDRCKIIFK